MLAVSRRHTMRSFFVTQWETRVVHRTMDENDSEVDKIGSGVV